MNSRAKGKRVELALVRELKGYGFEVRRGQQYCGANGDADVVGINGIHIECKGVENLNIREAMAQACRDAKPDEYPVVMYKHNRKPWMAAMLAEDIAMMVNFFGVGICKRHEPDRPMVTMTLADWVTLYRSAI